MKIKTENFICQFSWFWIGVFLTFALAPSLNFIKGFIFGVEIHSVVSLPMDHTAKIRTRPGLGDQTLFFEVDGRDVWQSGDMPGGDLKEELSWDTNGKIVTLELEKKPVIRYDTESEKLIKVENEWF